MIALRQPVLVAAVYLADLGQDYGVTSARPSGTRRCEIKPATSPRKVLTAYDPCSRLLRLL